MYLSNYLFLLLIKVVVLPDENKCEEKGGVARCCSVYVCQRGGQSENSTRDILSTSLNSRDTAIL